MTTNGSRAEAGGPELRIRKAIRSDIDALEQIEAEAFPTNRLSRNRFLALTRSPSAVILVAVRSSVVVGSAILLTRRGAAWARLYSLAVAAGERGRGTGQLLLTAAEESARERGCLRLHLEVRADNRSAQRLYESAGYQPAGERLDYYEDGMTALLYRRALGHAGRSPAGAAGRAAA
jgi:ribosomal protein S18 acetylase RimI-like enzyme